MSEWAPKRFWTDATVTDADGGFTVLLDKRAVKTPAKAPLILPTQAMAQAIAEEWQAQTDKIDPNTMPVTRSANAAIDKVRIQHAEVADMIAAYGDSDLLCYRADSPEELVARQAETWDPYLAWAEEALGAKLEPRTGVIHAGQDAASLTRLSEAVHAFDPFELTAFHDLVSLTGSLILGFAAERSWAESSSIWSASRVDENWQIEQWGEDEEAQATEQVKKRSFEDALRFIHLSRGSNGL
ncbi:Chaperone required for the assembly of the F1-ATPase [Thalassococcus halodurans]|uniref:Chaperone required for the assembly of the F1-ATPase n=1 Tax=Thalassococcus halodurans TaxID=373675 RepID=A0A1H5TT19_9RHOB|nr:ATP12 family protein [Thalassococcus halodurans]SEF65944.1 Chaperone required for the assembly of the F1-ATPase [Thalassococcus halodurans]